MTDIVEQALNNSTSAEVLELGGAEHLFHKLIGQGKLDEFLGRFPRASIINDFVSQKILTFGALQAEWQDTLLSEVNALISHVSPGALIPATKVVVSQANPGTDEMFCLNAELNYVFQDHADRGLSSDDRALLRSVFYGIDFTHWTKWAVLLNYTDLDIDLTTLTCARRNNVDIVLDGSDLKVSQKHVS